MELICIITRGGVVEISATGRWIINTGLYRLLISCHLQVVQMTELPAHPYWPQIMLVKLLEPRVQLGSSFRVTWKTVRFTIQNSKNKFEQN
jgi:hypothetical protein